MRYHDRHEHDGSPVKTLLCQAVKITLVVLLTSAVASCAASVNTEKPVGIGSTPNTLKSSPCSCIELKNLANS